MVLASHFQTWSYRGRGSVRESSAVLSSSEPHTSLSPWCTESFQSLGKTLMLNSHIILNQTELVAQLKYVTLDLVHIQLCRKVDFDACQIKIKLKCFQFSVVYDFPLSDSDSRPSFLEVYFIGGNIDYCATGRGRGVLKMTCMPTAESSSLFSPNSNHISSENNPDTRMRCSPYFTTS